MLGAIIFRELPFADIIVCFTRMHPTYPAIHLWAMNSAGAV